MPPAAPEIALERAMRRNLRILPWWWLLRWVWLGEGVWVIYLTDERGITLGQVLLFQAAYSVMVIAAEMPTGMLADRWGRRLSVILGCVAAAGAPFIFGIAGAFPMLLVSYMVFALAEALFSGADSALLFDTLRVLGRDAEFARWQARERTVAAAAIGAYTLVGALLVRWGPLALPFLISSVVTIPGVALACMLAEPPRHDQGRSFVGIGRDAVRAVVGRRALLAAALLMGLVTVAIHTMGINLQPVAIAYGAPVWSLGIFVGAQLAFSALSAAVADRLGRRIGIAAVFISMPLLSALALLGGVGSHLWLYPVFILPSLGWNVLWPHVVDFIARRVDGDIRATALSVASVTTHVMTIAALPLIGLGIDHRGRDGGLALAALALALVSLAVFALWWRAGDRTTADTEAYPLT